MDNGNKISYENYLTYINSFYDEAIIKEMKKMGISNENLRSYSSNSDAILPKSLDKTIEDFSIRDDTKIVKKATIEDCNNLIELYQRINEDLDINISVEESILYLKDLMINGKYHIYYDNNIISIPYVSNTVLTDERLQSLKKDKNIFRAFTYIYQIDSRLVSSFTDGLSYINKALIKPRNYASYGYIKIHYGNYYVTSPVVKLIKDLIKINDNIQSEKNNLISESEVQLNANMEYHKLKHELNSITNKLNDLKNRHSGLKINVENVKNKIKDDYITANLDKIKCDIDLGYSEEIDENFKKIKDSLKKSVKSLEDYKKTLDESVIQKIRVNVTGRVGEDSVTFHGNSYNDLETISVNVSVNTTTPDWLEPDDSFMFEEEPDFEEEPESEQSSDLPI